MVPMKLQVMTTGSSRTPGVKNGEKKVTSDSLEIWIPRVQENAVFNSLQFNLSSEQVDKFDFMKFDA